jgi:F0F1-type ATP synthase assembly protein I
LEWLLVASTLFGVVVGGINIIWSGCWWYQHYFEWLLVVSTLFGVVVGGINIITTPNNVDATNNHSK